MDNLQYGSAFVGSFVQIAISWITFTDGRSPLLMSAAAPPRQLKLSESAPTLIPLPSTANVLRAISERIA